MSTFIDKLQRKLNIPIFASEKLTSDIIWNFVSFGIIAVCGVILNILIVAIYDSSALGLFNQIYAIFIVLSQLAVNGIHFSVLKSVSLGGTQHELAQIFTSALICVLIVSLAVIGLTYPLTNFASNIFDSQFMTAGIKLVLPGLFFFAINKTVLSFLNGQRRMKTFAIFQTLRSIFLLGFLLLHARFVHNGNTISIIFSLSEGLLFIFFLPVIYRNFSIRFDRKLFQNAIQHFRFGLKATGGNILLELNTKLDVLILGLFVSDSEVGIFSFAALFIEGFLQFPTIIRNNINPLLATRYRQSDLADFQKFIRSVIKISYIIFIPLSLIGMLIFPVVGLVKTDIYIPTAWLFFVIMLSGMMIASGYLPLLMTFTQAGKPGLQSLVLITTTAFLVISIFVLTWQLGTLGTAIGVGLTYIIQAVIIKNTIDRRIIG